MKALFLVFYGFQEYNGISKKIRYQINALKKCGFDIQTCHYEVTPNGNREWLIDGKELVNLGRGITAKLKKRIFFHPILQYIKEENISYVYIRSYHNANPFTIHFVKELKKLKAAVFLEIPTYPYDQEYFSAIDKLQLCTDRLFRRKLCKYVDAIITFSNNTEIFGQRTIRISNGIDFNSIPIRKTIHDISKELHLIGVAEIHFWHGFDRLIKGLGKYYKNHPKYKVYFHLVGNMSGERERREIETPIREYGIESYVICHGAKHGEALNTLFEQADFAIGSLARHRSGIYDIKTLKNREYAARGFAFTYSETDTDFDHMPYVLKTVADESPIDISQLITFCHSQALSPQEIRDSIRHLSWEEQMKKICKDSSLQQTSYS